MKCYYNLQSKFNACNNVTKFYKNVLPSKDYPNLLKNAKKNTFNVWFDISM